MGRQKNEDENFYLLKEFKFENFVNAQDFVNKVGTIAETEGITQIYGLAGDTQKLKHYSCYKLSS